MIEINLLPPEFVLAKKEAAKPPYYQMALVGGILFFILTMFFYFSFLSGRDRLKKLDVEWQMIQPEYRVLTQLQKDLDGNVKVEKEFMQRFVTTQRPLTNVLGWLSEYLPSTAWLAEVRLGREGASENLFIRGLATPSRDRSSIEQIEEYLHQLKVQMPDARLSLTTTRQKIEGNEITQFIANFTWPSSTGK